MRFASLDATELSSFYRSKIFRELSTSRFVQAKFVRKRASAIKIGRNVRERNGSSLSRIDNDRSLHPRFRAAGESINTQVIR